MRQKKANKKVPGILRYRVMASANKTVMPPLFPIHHVPRYLTDSKHCLPRDRPVLPGSLSDLL